MEREIKYFSAFTGIGGFELGIEQAYEKYNLLGEQSEKCSNNDESLSVPNNCNVGRRRPCPTCIGYSEIDKYACSVYQKHFPNYKNYGDICSIKWEEVPDIDLIVGGWPCQSFSIAGKRGGFEDTRGTLFFEVIRMLKEKQPLFFIGENVKGLISHDKGATIEIVAELLCNCGYYVNIELYNSKLHGVPQNRERLFFVCTHARNLCDIINGGQLKRTSTCVQVIEQWLFQLLLNNLVELKKLPEDVVKDWGLLYLMLVETENRGLEMKTTSSGLTSQKLLQSLQNYSKAGVRQLSLIEDINLEESNTIKPKSTGLVELTLESAMIENGWQSLAILWSNKSAEGSKEQNMSTISTEIKKIIESKTYTYTKMFRLILLATCHFRQSYPNLWKEVLSNLTLIREDTKYARISEKNEGAFITESGNGYKHSWSTLPLLLIAKRHLGNGSRPEVFPITRANKKNNERSEQKVRFINQQTRSADRPSLKYSSGGSGALCKYNEAFCLPTSGSGGQYIQQLNQPKHSNNRVYDPNGISPTLNTMQGGNRQPFREDDELSFKIGKGTKLEIDKSDKKTASIRTSGDRGKQKTYLKYEEVQTLSANPMSDNIPRIVQVNQPTHSNDRVYGGVKGMSIRRLTPLECERLQSFPDNWTKYGKDGEEISDTQRYKMCGNAVTVNVVREIIKYLI